MRSIHLCPRIIFKEKSSCVINRDNSRENKLLFEEIYDSSEVINIDIGRENPMLLEEISENASNITEYTTIIRM